MSFALFRWALILGQYSDGVGGMGKGWEADKDTVGVVMTSVSTHAIALLGHRDVEAGPISGPQHSISVLHCQHYLSHDNGANGVHRVGKMICKWHTAHYPSQQNALQKSRPVNVSQLIYWGWIVIECLFTME